MPDDIIRTVIEAVDNASSVIDKVGADYEGLNKILEDLGAVTDAQSQRDDQLTQASYNLEAAANRLSVAQQELAANTDPARQNELGKAVADAQVALNSAANSVKEFTQNEADAEQQNKSWEESFTGLSTEAQAAIAGITAGLAVLKKGWDFAEEGAAINRTSEQFAAAMSAMGQNADAVMTKMKAAVHNTIDDEILAQAATRAFTQGIVNSGDQMAAVLELARAKGILLGRDTQDVLQSILQSTDMLSTRGFKQLGINLESVTKLTDDYAKKNGISAASIDIETQKSILLSAALDQSKAAIERVNSAGDDQLTKMQQLETSFTELGDTIKSAFADATVPAIDSASMIVKAITPTVDVEQKLRNAIVLSTLTMGENSVMTRQLSDQLMIYLKTKNQIIAAEQRGMDILNAANSSMVVAVDKTDGLVHATDNLDQGMRNVADRERDAANATADWKAAVDSAKESISILDSEIAGAVGKEMMAYTTKQADLSKKMADTKAQLDKLIGTQGASIIQTNKSALSANELALVQSKLANATALLTAHTQRAGESNTAFAARMDGLKVQIDGYNAKLGLASKAVVGFVDNSKKIDELKTTYADLQKQYDDEAKAHRAATDKILFDIAEKNLATLQSTGKISAMEEATAVNALALKYGLVDQATATATTNIIAANAKLAQDGNLDAYLATLGMVSQTTSQTADVTAAADQSVTDAHAAMVKAMGAAPIEVKVDSKPLTDFQQHMADRVPFDKYNQVQRDMATAHQTLTDKIGTDTTEIIGYQQAMSDNPAIPAYADNVHSMAQAAHGYYADIRNDIDQTIARQQALTQALAAGAGGGSTGAPAPTPSPSPVAGHGMASGGSYIVPPNPFGNIGDYYPVRAAPGEEVTVKTPMQQVHADKGNGNTIIDNSITNVYNPIAAAMLAAQRRAALLAHSNARMGG